MKITDEQLRDKIKLLNFIPKDTDAKFVKDVCYDLLSARQTIAEQGERIKELEAERGEKKPNYDPDDFRVGKGK